MKTTTVFRNILISTQALSLPMGSSAFVLEMRQHHRSHTRSTGIHASVSALPATPQRECETDFVAAATEAAIERQYAEAASFNAYAAIQLYPRTAVIEREATSSSRSSSASVVPTIRKVYEMPVYSTSTEEIAEEDNDEFELEFDFIAAATDAAIDREKEEAAFFNTLPWELKLLVFAERIGTGLRQQVRSYIVLLVLLLCQARAAVAN
jgi:hypothetical protein